MHKIDLVLQGKFDAYSYEIAQHYLQLPFVNNIIASCWKTDSIPYANSRIRFVQSEDVSLPGITNRNRQIKSSLAGIQQVQTDFAVKLRSDQKISLSSMTMMHQFYQRHKTRELTYANDANRPYNQICVAGIFRPFPYHPRDHLFWGNTQDLIELFDIPLDMDPAATDNYSLYTRSETYIAAWYFAKFDPSIQEHIHNPRIFLTDGAPRIQEALAKSDALGPKVFKPFPKIDFEWPKHGLASYHYHYTETVLGEYFGRNDE